MIGYPNLFFESGRVYPPRGTGVLYESESKIPRFADTVLLSRKRSHRPRTIVRTRSDRPDNFGTRLDEAAPRDRSIVCVCVPLDGGLAPSNEELPNIEHIYIYTYARGRRRFLSVGSLPGRSPVIIHRAVASYRDCPTRRGSPIYIHVRTRSSSFLSVGSLSGRSPVVINRAVASYRSSYRSSMAGRFMRKQHSKRKRGSGSTEEEEEEETKNAMELDRGWLVDY